MRCWLVHVALFTHVFAGALRYAEAKEMVRRILEEPERGEEFLDDWRSCDGDDDSCSTASGFESACESWPEDESEDWSASDFLAELPHAAPCEEDVGLPTPTNCADREAPVKRVAFDRDYESTCDAGMVNEKLVDGTWRYNERLGARVQGSLRAIARARQQRGGIVADMPVSERTPLRDEHPHVLFKGAEGTLILDAQCGWSNAGYVPRAAAEPFSTAAVPFADGRLSPKGEARSIDLTEELAPHGSVLSETDAGSRAPHGSDFSKSEVQAAPGLEASTHSGEGGDADLPWLVPNQYLSEVEN